MWNMDFDSLIQLLMIVVFVGVAVLQLLYRVFVKPVADAESKRRQMEQQGKDPAKTLRDFLAEVRGEAPASPAEEEEPALRGEPRREERRLEEELVEARWENVEDEVPPPLPPKAPQVRPPERARPRRRVPGPRPMKGARAPSEARKKARELVESLPEGEKFAFAGGKIDSHVGEHLDERFAEHLGPGVETTFQGEARPRGAKRLLASRHLPSGIGLREAILAQVILGPPRAKTGKRPPRRGWARA